MSIPSELGHLAMPDTVLARIHSAKLNIHDYDLNPYKYKSKRNFFSFIRLVSPPVIQSHFVRELCDAI